MERTVVLLDTSHLTAYDYDAITIELENAGKLYDQQRLSHVAFNRNGTWCVVDVWESPQAFASFAQNTLGPIFAKLGLPVIEPVIFPAHSYLGTHAEEPMSA